MNSSPGECFFTKDILALIIYTPFLARSLLSQFIPSKTDLVGGKSRQKMYHRQGASSNKE